MSSSKSWPTRKPCDSRMLSPLVWRSTPAALAESLSAGGWTRAAHLLALSFALVDAAMGRRPRLLVMMPPRHGKSELVSHWFPVWLLACWPWRRVLLASYEADFATTWGRKVRNTLARYETELGVVIAEDSAAATRWDTAEGGGMIKAGDIDLITLTDDVEEAVEFIVAWADGVNTDLAP